MTETQTLDLDLFKGQVPSDVDTVFRVLKDAGYEVYLVGGAVRDLLHFQDGERVIRQTDFDFATNAVPREVMKLFSHQHIFTVPTGLKHGTVTVVLNQKNFEITTYRTESEYSDGRHPDKVQFAGSIIEDLSRRDFTINAMAYDVREKKLIDPFGGWNDLREGVIRTVGEPSERFSEDGLRPVRACRLAAYLQFRIEDKTFQAISETLPVIQKVSMERIQAEFMKLMKSVKPSVGLEYMRESGILGLFLPELMEGFEVDQNEYHRFDVYYHNIYACDHVSPSRPLVRFAALLHDIGKPRSKEFALKNGNGNVFYNHEVIGSKMAYKILKRFKFSNTDRERMLNLIKMHMFYYTEDWTDGAVRRFLRKFEGDMSFLEDLFELRRGDRAGSGMKKGEAEILARFRQRIDRIIEQDNALKVTDLEINGYDLMEHFSLKPGRTIGMVLEYLLEKVLDEPELNRKEELLRLAGEFLKEGSSLANTPHDGIISMERHK